MVWNATTLANVHDILKVPAGNTSIDDDINALIPAVSLRAERYIGRSFEQAARTETYDVTRRTRSIFLKNYPVDTGETFEIRNDTNRTFANDAMSGTVYDLDSLTGRVYFMSTLLPGPNVLQVIYTGGITDSEANLQAIEDLEFAIRMQVAHEYRRRTTPAAAKATGSQQKAVEFQGQGELNWLAQTRAVLDSYRGVFIGGGQL